jgi:glycosyltransferase involved in cell wall biosynthesis
MTQQRNPAPRLAVIVGNAITGDSRVQKTALSAAHAGWNVTLIGQTLGDRVERTRLGPVSVVRVPVRRSLRRAESRRRRGTVRAKLLKTGLEQANEFDMYAATHESRMRWRSDRISRLSVRRPRALWALLVLALRVWTRVTHEIYLLRRRAYGWEERHQRDATEPIGDWQHDWPLLLDLDLAFGPVIEGFRPDVIHANDITMLPTAVRTAGRLRAAGHRVAWLYDAHEYVAGVEWPYPRMASAYPQVERELIHRADAVVTVSAEIADLLQREHGLATPPTVVLNAPVREAITHSGDRSVRRACGLADDVPLLVYSGYVHHARGLDTAIEALRSLPDVHLAVVANRSNPRVAELESLAVREQVGDRVHVVPYVPQHAVADYLASADLAVICFRHTPNNEYSLPTKLAEYVHARLPVVCSDVKTLSAYVREHGIGTVFTAEDPASMAVAVREALAARDTLRTNITEEILESLSWEHQARTLQQLYADLSGVTPSRPMADVNWDVEERPLGSAHIGRPEGAEGHPWRELGKTPIRLGLGPANYAGQLAGIATAVTAARRDVSAEVVMHTSARSFGYPADVHIKNSDLRNLDVQVEQLKRVLPRYTHLLNDAFRPVFGRLNGDHIADDLPALQEAGIKVGLLSHGSDSRDPDAHMERNPWSHFRDVPDDVSLDAVREITRRNRKFATDQGLPCFVTTPDLLDDLPQATWVPLVVDVDAWACDKPVFERPRPLVLHAPSKRWTKGTGHFIDQLEELDTRGVIEFRVVEGLPWEQMREQVQEADLVVDQFGVGAYGTFACEAMAAGKPVMVYLTPTVVKTIGFEPPVLNVTPDRVGEAVLELLDDRDRAAALGVAARAFARDLHDGTRAASALEEFLGRQ